MRWWTGTVVENTTILPYATVGAGLDVAHSVVGFRRVSHLHRGVEIEINDPKLIGMVSSAPLRVLEQAASLAAFLPTHFLRGLFLLQQRRHRPFPGSSPAGGQRETTDMAAAAQSPSPALKAAEAVATNTAFSNLP
jgi:hypothetical protein